MPAGIKEESINRTFSSFVQKFYGGSYVKINSADTLNGRMWSKKGNYGNERGLFWNSGN